MIESIRDAGNNPDQAENEKRDLLARTVYESFSKNILIGEKMKKAIIGDTYTGVSGKATHTQVMGKGAKKITEITELFMTLRQLNSPLSVGNIEDIRGTISLRPKGSNAKPEKYFIQLSESEEGVENIKLFNSSDIVPGSKDIDPLDSIKLEALLFWLKMFELEGVDIGLTSV